MLTSKQRATLKGLASKEDTILQVGKGGINDALVKQVSDAVNKRELIKIRALETTPQSIEEIARVLEERTGSELVHIIGTKIVLYKKNKKKPVIQI